MSDEKTPLIIRVTKTRGDIAQRVQETYAIELPPVFTDIVQSLATLAADAAKLLEKMRQGY